MKASNPTRSSVLEMERTGRDGAASSGRERILHEARTRFSTKGFADVTMQEIADAVGLTKAAVYYHFGDKECLFRDVFVDEMARVRTGITAELEAGAGLQMQLARIAQFLLETGRMGLTRLIADLDRYVEDERRVAIYAGASDLYDTLRPTLAQAMAAGEMRPVDLDLTIALFFAMIFGHIRSGLPAVAMPERLADAIAETMMWGIGV